MVSIGPCHHGSKELQAMEEHKLRYLQHNQTFKPPPDFEPFYFMANQYLDFAGESTGSNNSTSIGVIIGAAAGGCVLLFLLLLAGVCAYRQKKRAEKANDQNPFANWDPNKNSGSIPQVKGTRSFSFEELSKYTNKFAEANAIGSGGYGQDGARGALSRPHQSNVYSPWRLTKLVKETMGSIMLYALVQSSSNTCHGIKEVRRGARVYNLEGVLEAKEMSLTQVRNTYSDAAVSYSGTLWLDLILSCSKGGLEFVSSDGSCLVVVVPRVRVGRTNSMPAMCFESVCHTCITSHLRFCAILNPPYHYLMLPCLRGDAERVCAGTGAEQED
ncbi:hypothetical protein JRO89_XS02G0282400 [Xanthoceras sorbifolium]|uniref:Uncharacterized protein n=1 Tax=Xanthoceras sorbifolium TaxID=99658 RepID=A0ABQ8IH96_9ROSI|nr:hypothetical protein JRO89_XS02G0282400 [Xanthoceras sorbifolium]